MRVLMIYCHPNPHSFTAAVRSKVADVFEDAGAEIRILDLYARGFSAVLSREELDGYLNSPSNQAGLEEDIEAISWCDTLIFVYPTWWYGLPAMLKGWLDRVLLPGVAFVMPEKEVGRIKPALKHIERLGIFTTGGASRLMTIFVGQPGRRTLARGVGSLCGLKRPVAFAMHYLMDSSSPKSRRAHLRKVERVAMRLARS